MKAGALVDVKNYNEDLMRPAESYHIIFNGQVFRTDAPGNIVYGYLGTTIGLEPPTLLSGDGIYQIYSDYVLNPIEYSRFFNGLFGDNDEDSTQISLGIKFYPLYNLTKNKYCLSN